MTRRGLKRLLSLKYIITTLCCCKIVNGFANGLRTTSLTRQVVSKLPSRTYSSSSFPLSRPQQWSLDRQIRKHSSSIRMSVLEEEPADPDRYTKALINTAFSVGAATLFGAGISVFKGMDSSIEFFAGYVVEQSLSVDNLFVFLLLFDNFKVPLNYQPRVLSWGILGAVVMRGIFIALGEAALDAFQPMLLVFAAILVASSYKLLVEDEEEDEDLSDNQIVQFSQKFLKATDEYDGDKFFSLVDGVKRATPLLLCLVCVELSDIVFAVDSIPAVFGVTRDPFIVYTSNIFAILNLRSLYTVLANAVGDLVYLRPAVALVLGFVGMKLTGEYFGHEISTVASLAVISSLLGSGVLLSFNEKRKEAEDAEIRAAEEK